MEKHKFNDNWKFSSADGSIKNKDVCLPHDAMQEEGRIPGLKNGESTAYYPGGTYIYEKDFVCDEFSAKQTMFLEFEGIYQKSKVYLNDRLIGGHIYGYTDFFADLTGRCQIGNNRIKVIADNSQTPNSRWYTGSGIYRDVYLHCAGKEYLVPQSVKISTLSLEPAKIRISAEAVCECDTELTVDVIEGRKTVAAGRALMTESESGMISETVIEIPNARLWSAEEPNLYQVRLALWRNGEEIDAVTERFGIRQIKVSHEKGFQINNHTVKLRGGCIHHDNGFLGACSYRNAELRRVKKLKAAGFNAIRYAHNPAPKTFLDVCDEVGMYVMDEAFDAWEYRKNDWDYGLYFAQEWEQDLSAMIRVAYNHPSVVLYSIGNEILDIGAPSGAEWSKKLVDCCHKNDPTRPVLNALSPWMVCLVAKGIGINTSEVNPENIVNPKEISEDSKAGGSKLVNMLITTGPFIMKLIGGPKKTEKYASDSIVPLDITGYNYGMKNYPVHMKNHPHSVLVGSETHNAEIAKHWKYVEEHDFMIGEFTWTAWDYLGETGIGVPRYEDMSHEFCYPYPCITGYCGCFDLAGDMDGEGAHVAAVWNMLDKPFLAVSPINRYGQKVKMGSWRSMDAHPTWSWPGCEGKTAEIYVIANGNAAEAELYLNNRCLGRQKMEENKTVFHAAYEPGKLETVTYDIGGNEIGRSSLISAGTETKFTIVPDCREICGSERDVAYIDIYLTDEKGIVKMQEKRTVTVEAEGQGTLVGIGSANPLPLDSFTGNSYETYNGHVVAIVRPDGNVGAICITAKADGVEPQSVIIETK